jgi:hypothetical protein
MSLGPAEQYETVNRFRRTAPVDVDGLVVALGTKARARVLTPGHFGDDRKARRWRLPDHRQRD